MKKCPSCNQYFGDENDFCLDDGTPLLADGAAPGFGAHRPSDEIPTRYIPRPQAAPHVTAPNSSKWVYPVIGVLCGLVVVLGFFAFFKESSPDKGSVAQSNTVTTGSVKNPQDRTPRPDAPTPATPVPTPFPALPSNQTSSVVTVNSPRDGYLALKEEPCTMPCRTLLKIPHNTRLSLGTCKDSVEVADGRRGRWCYTSYGGLTGWVFDAFVTR